MYFTNTYTRIANIPMQMDAGNLREHLARELHQWKLEGSRSPNWVRSFWVKVKHLAKMVGKTSEDVHRELQEDAERISDEDEQEDMGRTSAKKGKAVNPWAICTNSVGRDDEDRYESCVMDVKKTHKIKKD